MTFIIQKSDGSLLGNSRGEPFQTMKDAQLSLAYILKQDPNAQITTDLSLQQRQRGMDNQEQYREPPPRERGKIGIYSPKPISYTPFRVPPAGKTFSKAPFTLPNKRRRYPTESEDVVYD